MFQICKLTNTKSDILQSRVGPLERRSMIILLSWHDEYKTLSVTVPRLSYDWRFVLRDILLRPQAW